MDLKLISIICFAFLMRSGDARRVSSGTNPFHIWY